MQPAKRIEELPPPHADHEWERDVHGKIRTRSVANVKAALRFAGVTHIKRRLVAKRSASAIRHVIKQTLYYLYSGPSSRRMIYGKPTYNVLAFRFEHDLGFRPTRKAMDEAIEELAAE